MESMLFRKFASLPGINIFNWRKKMVRAEEPIRVEPSIEDSHHSLHRKATVYFKKLIVQDKYIKAITTLLNNAEMEVKRFDDMQVAHEKEIQKIKAHYELEHSKSIVHQLRNENVQHGKTIKRLQQRVSELEALTRNGGVPLKISNRKVDKFVNHTQLLLKAMGKNESKDAKKIKLIAECFTKSLGFKAEQYFTSEELESL
jgi:hypothetical protein